MQAAELHHTLALGRASNIHTPVKTELLKCPIECPDMCQLMQVFVRAQAPCRKQRLISPAREMCNPKRLRMAMQQARVSTCSAFLVLLGTTSDRPDGSKSAELAPKVAPKTMQFRCRMRCAIIRN